MAVSPGTGLGTSRLSTGLSTFGVPPPCLGTALGAEFKLWNMRSLIANCRAKRSAA